MTVLKIAIFILMCAIGTAIMVVGAIKYMYGGAKTSVVIITSILVGVVNLAGSVLLTCLK